MARVLLIEDEHALGEALEYQLEREGYEVERVVDGLEGLERFKSMGPDLVILDLMLPGMSGRDVCRQIRASSRVPIIMLTARDSEIDKVVGLELGADDYVTKPFSTSELVARIKAVLRRSSVEGASVDGVLEGGGIPSTASDTRSACEGVPWSSRARNSSCWSCSWRTPGAC